MGEYQRGGAGLWLEQGGSGTRLLVLLHGMGATSAVWRPFSRILGERWPGRWLAPDLRGHGRSARAASYSFGLFAEDVAALLRQPSPEPITVLGHSMGGVVGLALASGWFGIDVVAAVGVGIKVAWTEPELERMRDLAARDPRWFDERREAETAALRLAGLQDLAGLESDLLDGTVSEEGGRYRLSWDSRAALVGAPPMRGLLAAAQGQVVLARGARDPMVSAEQLRALPATVLDLQGAGHNVQVEDPEGLWSLLAQIASTQWGSIP